MPKQISTGEMDAVLQGVSRFQNGAAMAELCKLPDPGLPRRTLPVTVFVRRNFRTGNGSGGELVVTENPTNCSKQVAIPGGRKRMMTDSKTATAKLFSTRPREVTKNPGASIPTLERWAPAS